MGFKVYQNTIIVSCCIALLSALGCKNKCWKCNVPHAITRFEDPDGKLSDVETYTEKERLAVIYNRTLVHYRFVTTVLLDTVIFDYCGTQKEMEKDIRINNTITKDERCYPEK